MSSNKKITTLDSFKRILIENFGYSEDDALFFGEKYLIFYKKFINFNTYRASRTLSERYVLNFRFVAENYDEDVIDAAIEEVVKIKETDRGTCISPMYFRRILETKQRKLN